jgi:hypothetical protein
MDDQRDDREGSGGMNPTPKRRWCRFSLRTFFLVLTVLALWFGWNVYQVRKREMVRQYINLLSASAIQPGEPLRRWQPLPIMWRILGAEPVQMIVLQNVPMGFDEKEQIKASFPEAKIYFKDEIR